MIDALPTLAFAIHSSPGVYALLLGSGISRSAKIPTGWEVTLDLARKLAAVQEAKPDADVVAWYRDRFGEEPDYAKLLERLATTAADRRQLLSNYFEPSAAHRDRGERVPTAAHRAIAQLVASGHVRVIVTTNFDRLLEDALGAENVQPQVISTPDGVSGMLPLAHAKCTIVKIHGDYLDARIRNTPAELDAYEPVLDELLDQIFDEYGLVVSGWSAEYDTALGRAIGRAPNRRFATYWSRVGEAGPTAKRIIAERRAVDVPTSGADAFFTKLAGMVSLLQGMDGHHPLTLPLAVAELKRAIERDTPITKHDLLRDLADRVTMQLGRADFHGPVVQLHTTELERRLARYEELLAPLVGVITTGAYWEEDGGADQYAPVLSRVLHAAGYIGGYSALDNLKMYPALLLLYAAGLASVAARKYATLAQFVRLPYRLPFGVPPKPLPLVLYPENVMRQEIGRLLSGMQSRLTPASDRLFDVLRPYLREYVEEDAYEELFSRFEYLYALTHVSAKPNGAKSGFGPIGRFHWQEGHSADGWPIAPIKEEMNAMADMWPPYAAGLFPGQFVDLVKRAEAFDAFRARLPWF